MATTLAAAVLLSWWIIGNVDEPGGDDYVWRFRFGEDHPTALGLLGVGLAAGVAADLTRSWWPRYGSSSLHPVVLALIAGCIVGWGVRIFTAAVGGANIGAGLMLMFAPFAVVPLLWRAGSRAARLPSTNAP